MSVQNEHGEFDYPDGSEVEVTVVATRTFTIWPGGCNVYERVPLTEMGLPDGLAQFYAYGEIPVKLPNGAVTIRRYLVDLDAPTLGEALDLLDVRNREEAERAVAAFQAEIRKAQTGLVDQAGKPLRAAPSPRGANISNAKIRGLNGANDAQKEP